ncbi:MAG: hypothetical protein LQ352_006789 [Teloschistes flavicans]|nr:MAG: hypothetical protein LQ352_006789 [Teloschistes flavicans]
MKAARFPPSNGQPPAPCPRVVDETVESTAGQNPIAERINPSILPDSFMRTLSPIIQIRHPALTVPSCYRAYMKSLQPFDVFSEEFLTNESFAASKMVFDWYCTHVYPERKRIPRGIQSWPLVVDGEDVANDNERVISAICSLAKLNVKGVTDEWQPVSKDIISKQPREVQSFGSTLQSSSGVIRSGLKADELSIDKETEKWVEEFGSKVGNRLREIAEAAMDDYMYLRQYRV